MGEMGVPLARLEATLRSKPGSLTSQEANYFMQCKTNALRTWCISSAVSGYVTWLASRPTANWRGIGNYHRVFFSMGTAFIFGFWRFGMSLDSCAEDIMSLEGTRMQKEMANIMLKLQRDEKWTQLISKHFYSEKVFDDSSADQPKLRWRYRNFFGDHISHNSNSYGEMTETEGFDSEKTDEPKQDYKMYAAVDPMKDPLDIMFGVPSGSEEIHHNDDSTSTTQQRKHERSHRRSHRKRRISHHEASSTLQHAQL